MIDTELDALIRSSMDGRAAEGGEDQQNSNSHASGSGDESQRERAIGLFVINGGHHGG